MPRPTALFPAPHLREYRLARRLSQAKLATAAGVARDSVGHLEAGGVARAETIERLANALTVTPEALMEPPLRHVAEDARAYGPDLEPLG